MNATVSRGTFDLYISLHSLSYPAALVNPPVHLKATKISYICYVDKCTLSAFDALTSYSSCCTFLSRSSHIMLYSTEMTTTLILTSQRHTPNLLILCHLNTVADDVYHAEWHSLGNARGGGRC